MSQMPHFRGKKGEIVARLGLGQSSKAIAEALDTVVGYVENVRSELRRKYGIEFPPSQTWPTETQSLIVQANAGPRTVQQAAPSAVSPTNLPQAAGPQISNVGTATAPPAAAETKSVNPEAPGATETVTPASDPLLQQVLDKEAELAETRARLKNLQRLTAADAANKSETYRLKHLEAVRNFRPSFRCNEHGCSLRHWSGPIFICDAGGHIGMYSCPMCHKPLAYDETGFSCVAC